MENLLDERDGVWHHEGMLAHPHFPAGRAEARLAY